MSSNTTSNQKEHYYFFDFIHDLQTTSAQEKAGTKENLKLFTHPQIFKNFWIGFHIGLLDFILTFIILVLSFIFFKIQYYYIYVYPIILFLYLFYIINFNVDNQTKLVNKKMKPFFYGVIFSEIIKVILLITGYIYIMKYSMKNKKYIYHTLKYYKFKKEFFINNINYFKLFKFLLGLDKIKIYESIIISSLILCLTFVIFLVKINNKKGIKQDEY